MVINKNQTINSSMQTQKLKKLHAVPHQLSLLNISKLNGMETAYNPTIIEVSNSYFLKMKKKEKEAKN